MRIEGYYKSGTVNSRPNPTIHVVAPNHPTKKKIQPLTRTSSRWLRKKVPDALRGGQVTIDQTKVNCAHARAEAVKCRAYVLSLSIVTSEEELFDRPFGLKYVA